MKTLSAIVLTAMTAVLLSSPLAQAQPDQQNLHELMAKSEDTLRDVTEFVGDVRFDEKDVQSVIELWPEFESMGEKIADDHEGDDTQADFQAILKDPTFQAWISKHHLDRENWLRRALRIQLLTSKAELDSGGMPDQAQLKEQMKRLEGMREQMGEEAYQQMVKTMNAASSMMNSMSDTFGDLPPASEEEQALLDKYREPLKGVMNRQPP